MQQASPFDGGAFDILPLQQDGLTAPEVDFGEREIVQALAVAPVIVVADEGVDCRNVRIDETLLAFEGNDTEASP